VLRVFRNRPRLLHPTPFQSLKKRHICVRLRLKCDGTRAGSRFRPSAKRTSPFKSARGVSSVGVLAAEVCAISGSNAGYTMFRGSVKGTGCPLHSSVSPSLPPPVRHRVPSHFNWTLPPNNPALASNPLRLGRTGYLHIRLILRFLPWILKIFERP